MRRISQARLLAVAIILRNFSSDQEQKLLNQWERTTFRIFGLCGKDARTRVGHYVRLGWDILKDTELNADDVLNRIKNISEGKDYSIESILNQLKNSNCYEEWEDELRYLLFRYEEYLADQSGQTFSNEQWNRIWQTSAARSIEHILPQSKGSQIEGDKEGIFVHRLGNLLLLPPNLNSQLRDRDPEEKSEAYIDTGLLIAKEVGQTIRQSGWGAEQVQEREKRLLEWIRSEWS